MFHTSPKRLLARNNLRLDRYSGAMPSPDSGAIGDFRYDTSWFSTALPERGWQQKVSAMQCRLPEFGRRPPICLAECSAEMAVAGKTQLLA